MANEIRYGQNVTLTNTGLNDTYNTSGLTADQTNRGLVRNVQEVSTTWTGDALVLGGISTPGMAVLSNIDTVNFIEVGISVSGNFHPFLRLDAGRQAGPMWLGTSELYARANTSPVQLFYVIYEA